MNKFHILFIVTILLSLTRLIQYHITMNECYSDVIWNNLRAIPGEDFVMPENMFLTEMPDSWFRKKLDAVINTQITSDQLIGIPIEITWNKFRILMGNIIGKYLINYFNTFVSETTSDNNKVLYNLQSFDVLEIIYHQLDKPFESIAKQFYLQATNVQPEHFNPNLGNSILIKSQHVIYRQSKAWGILLYIKSIHFPNQIEPMIISYQILGKIFSDKLNNLITDTSHFANII